MDEDQNQNSGDSVDFLNSSINSLAGTASNFKSTSMMLSPHFWLVLGAIVVVVVVIATITVVFGNTGQASEGNQTAQNVNEIPRSTTCTSGDPVSCLSKDFNIQAVGFDGDNKKFAQEVFDAFSIAYQKSPLYAKLWNNGGEKLILSYGSPNHPLSEGSSCQGQAFPGNNETTDLMNVWNWGTPERETCGPTGGDAYLIIHETGHILSGRNPRLLNKFIGKLPELQAADKDCYNRRTYTDSKGNLRQKGMLLTYIGPGSIVEEENFAEGIADYVLYPSWQSWNSSASLTDFPSRCPNTYQWFKDNIFGIDIVQQ